MRQRSSYPKPFKAQVVQECLQPGATVSSVAITLDQMTPEQLRALAAQALQLQSQVEAMSKKIQSDETIIKQLTYEIALLKRHKFAKRSEQISPAQGSLLDDLLDTDLESIEAELKQLCENSY